MRGEQVAGQVQQVVQSIGADGEQQGEAGGASGGPAGVVATRQAISDEQGGRGKDVDGDGQQRREVVQAGMTSEVAQGGEADGGRCR